MRSLLSLCVLGALFPMTGCAEHVRQDSYTSTYSSTSANQDSYRVVDTTARPRDKVIASSEAVIDRDANNSAQNTRDRNFDNLTPLDQSNDPQDIDITRQMRRAIVGDKSLSMSAHNIKIITSHQIMTLRGPVNSIAERDVISDKARTIPGVVTVNNQLDVTTR